MVQPQPLRRRQGTPASGRAGSLHPTPRQLVQRLGWKVNCRDILGIPPSVEPPVRKRNPARPVPDSGGCCRGARPASETRVGLSSFRESKRLLVRNEGSPGLSDDLGSSVLPLRFAMAWVFCWEKRNVFPSVRCFASRRQWFISHSRSTRAEYSHEYHTFSYSIN